MEALRSAGPAAATLCQGWDAHDLAVHVWLREHEFATALGVAGGPLAARLTRRMAQVRAERGFDDLVDVFAAGPGKFSPLALPAVDAAFNSVEYFVHTEDVRRAQPDWPIREPGVDYQQWAWRAVTRLAPLRLRSAGVSVVVESLADSQTQRIGKGGEIVTLLGLPTELLLLLFGRGAAARVRHLGDPDAVERVRGLKLSA